VASLLLDVVSRERPTKIQGKTSLERCTHTHTHTHSHTGEVGGRENASTPHITHARVHTYKITERTHAHLLRWAGSRINILRTSNVQLYPQQIIPAKAQFATLLRPCHCFFSQENGILRRTFHFLWPCCCTQSANKLSIPKSSSLASIERKKKKI